MHGFDPSREHQRRNLLRTAGGGIAAAAGLAQAVAAAGRQDAPRASITFEDQQSGGDSVVIAAVSTTVDARIHVVEDASGKETFYGAMSISAGTDAKDLTVDLDTPIADTQQVQVLVVGPDDELLARDTALVAVGEDAEHADQYGVSFVEADPGAGFNYPYYLFVPAPDGDGEVPLLVEPNNTGTATDDFQAHRESARDRVESGLSRRLSEELGVPLLMPVFPRPRSDPVDGTHYVHQLDRDTLAISGGPLERVDLQLLRMVEHAKGRLSETPYSFRDRIMLNGFSASGNFVDRFTVLHPDRVLSVTAGGLNGMTVLPMAEAEGRSLPYHVGIADVEELTGEPVDLEALDEVNQLLYMGSEDSNDTLPYTDAWTSDELRATAKAVYGEDMIADRFPTCYRAYREAGVTAQFRIYEGAGHTPQPAVEDIRAFHERSMAGEPVDDFGQSLGTTAAVERTPANPGAGRRVEFSAGGSRANVGELLAYTWEFGDGGTAAGETVTHTYDSPGRYTVTLKVVDSNGGTDTAEVTVAVGGATTADATTADATSADTGDEPTPTEGDTTESGGQPGFGPGTAISGVAGAAYLLYRRATGEDAGPE